MPRKWVLIIDDDPTVLGMMETALDHPDLSVTTAKDAAAGFIQAQNLKPFVIICDINMPGDGNGATVLKRLRDDANNPRVPFIFMTGMEPAKAKALLPQNDPTIGFMQKPFDMERLREYVWNLAGISKGEKK
ncbi:MAG: response regulator [Elusimicrobiota bacterium]